MGMIDMSKVEADYLKYRFKQYLGSVSREIQNRKLKEQKMGMIIIKNYSMPHNCYACDLHNYHECDLTTESIEEDYCWNGDSREKHCPLREVEAIPKADYENRLRADMVAMLTDIQLEIEEKYPKCDLCEYFVDYDYDENDISEYRSVGSITDITNLIQQKINSLKEKS